MKFRNTGIIYRLKQAFPIVGRIRNALRVGLFSQRKRNRVRATPVRIIQEGFWTAPGREGPRMVPFAEILSGPAKGQIRRIHTLSDTAPFEIGKTTKLFFDPLWDTLYINANRRKRYIAYAILAAGILIPLAVIALIVCALT
jgi:hypothetical protein